MNNEPVAWVDEIWVTRPDLVRTQNLDIGRLFMRSAEGVKNYIPLYTHPAKTLTQENHEWDRGVWTVGIDGMTKEFIESSDFHHDVRLYLNGDFETDTQRLNYLQHIADRLNAHPVKTDKAELDTRSYMLGYADGKEVKTLTDEEIDAIGDEVSNLIDTYAGRREFARAILRKAQEK